jgi:hypothetical protein
MKFKTPIGSMSDCQVLYFFTKVGLTKEGDEHYIMKRSHQIFTTDENTLLSESPFNVLKDSVVGIDKK